MNPLTVISFMIPAFVAIGLITLLIKERYNFAPRSKNIRGGQNTENQNNQQVQNYINNRFANTKKYPDDFLDLSGGAMGI